MNQKKKICAIFAMVFLISSIALAALPSANAVGSITLTPTTQAQSGSVVVAGVGFAASQAVSIVLGTEITVVNESHPIASPAGTGPFTAYTSHGSIKPGSLYYHCIVSSDSSVVESDYYDNGDGTLTSSSAYALNPFVNYVTGAFGRSTTSAWDGYTVVYTASYTYYQYNLTRTTTTSTGTFSATINVPANVTNGNIVVTALDINGNKGTATLTVNSAVPEGLSTALVIVLSAAAVVASTYVLRKPKSKIISPSKTI